MITDIIQLYMKKELFKILFFICCFLPVSLRVNAQEKQLTLLYFRFDKAVVDSGYMDNIHSLRHLDEVLSDTAWTSRIDSINILSFASPDGNCLYNGRLAKRRSSALKGYFLRKYPYLNEDRIHPCPQGENWNKLRCLISADKELPAREKVLRIIDNTPDNDRCKVLLRNLHKGVPYRYIQERFSQYLRNAAVRIVWLCADSLPVLPEPVNPCTVIVDRPQIRLNPVSVVKEPFITKRPLIALKTNLLFDAAMMPNIEIEVPMGNRWSINAEYMFPWWLFDSDKYCMQILMGGLEGRYWLGGRKKRQQTEVLTGHFLGLYAGGGKYDLQWDDNGYQGEFFIAAGISYGWATRIARDLRLEFNIGIGLLRTDYRHYHARDNHQTLLWQENGRYTWFGPTKAKISFVWLLNRKVKKGGAR